MKRESRTISLGLFAVAVIELATCAGHGGEGLISSWFHGMRVDNPDCGLLYAITSSLFLALLFSTPLLTRRDAMGPRRLSFLAPCLPHLLARRRHGIVHGVRVGAALLAVWSFLGVSATFVGNPMGFGTSLYPVVLLVSVCLLRFVLLDLPDEGDVWTPGSHATEVAMLGDPVKEQIIFSLPAGWLAVVIDYLSNIPRLSQAKNTGLVVKRAGERAFLFHPGTVYSGGHYTTMHIGQTMIRLRVDVAITRHAEEIQLAALNMSGGLPSKDDIRSEVNLAVHTKIQQDIQASDAFTALEQQTSAYLLLNAEAHPGRNFDALRTFNAGLEYVRQVMTGASDILKQNLIQAESREEFKLSHGLFYARVYLEDVYLSPRALESFQNIRLDLTQTLTEMQRDKEGNAENISKLLDAARDLDLKQTQLQSILRGEVGTALPGVEQPLLQNDKNENHNLSASTDANAAQTIFGSRF